jgi:hypothetical protein
MRVEPHPGRKIVKRTIGLVVLLGIVVAAVALVGSAGAENANDRVLRSKLIGNTPGDPTLFDVAPAGAAWEVAASDVDVRRDGRIEVKVEGLVIAGRGTVGITAVTASLYCNGTLVGTTDPSPLSTDGDAEIDDTLAETVPAECPVPAVFVSPNGRPKVFFAVTGA